MRSNSLNTLLLAASLQACNQLPNPMDRDGSPPVGDASDATSPGVDAASNCFSVNTPGQHCDTDDDCCSHRCANWVGGDHKCLPNEYTMTPCANGSDCEGNGLDGSHGLCDLVPLPDGGTGMRCAVYPVGMSCNPIMRECPGGCSRTTMTCLPAPQGSPCMRSRGDADCLPGLHCILATAATGSGGCQP